MENISSFVTGPLNTGQTVLLASISGNFYVLRPDPNPNFIPYFGQVNATNNGNFQSLNLTANATNPPTYTLLAGSQGFTQTDPDGLIMLVPGSGNFNYQFATNGSTGSFGLNISPGTPLVPNLPVNLMVNSITLNFPFKNPTQEQDDVNNASSSFYLPTYDGTVSNVFIFPLVTYPVGLCSANTNGAYVDVVSGTQTFSTYFTQSDWCQANLIVPSGAPFCVNNTPCGTQTSGQGTNGSAGPCFGPCTTNICGPGSTTPGSTLNCSGTSTGLGLTDTDIAIIVGIVLIILIGIITFVVTR